jgi:acetolactate synthase I/II/III large subunit
MKSSELFVKCLENEGVTHLFGLPGEENMDFLDALVDSSVQFISTRHEQGAAFMADVFGRLTGKAGVCLSTLGPGATNLITGVADANLDRAPLVAITGNADMKRWHKESHQVIDVISIFKPITKWNTPIRSAEIIPEVVRKAFKVAQTEKPGATHIDVPEDQLRIEVDAEPLRVQQPPVPEPLERQIAKAAEILKSARSPVILAGNGVVRSFASEALTRFVDRLNIPVSNTFMAKGVVPYTNPHSLQTVGLQDRDYVLCGIERADVVITVGYDIVEYPPSLWNPEADKKIIHIDTLPAEVDKAYIIEVGVVGDISIALNELSERVPAFQDSYTTKLRELILGEIETYSADDSYPMKPQRILSDVRSFLSDDDIIISDVGAHKMWIARLYPCSKPNTCIISNGFASMGIALPGAIAARMIYPHKRVLAVTGDGGFMMNSQEIETAVRYNIPVVVLILNDNAYGLIGWKQHTIFKREAFVRLGNPDFVTYAQSFGALGYRILHPSELVPVLNEAYNKKLPAVIDCPVDYTENLRLTEKLGNIVCPI